MNQEFKKLLGVAVLALPMAFMSAPSHAVPVGLELSLLIDVSGSVDDTEYALQKNGYIQAFQSAAVQNAILNSVGGAIAVNFIEWSSGGQQAQTVGWTLIDSAASANAFAAAIAATVRSFDNSTAPGSAINFAVPLFASNGFEGVRQVIDVSGDGQENDGADTSDARDAALLAGIDTINGLAIGSVTLATWYENNIEGGTNSFVVRVDDFADFASAIELKLVREVTGEVPEPGTLALLGAGLFGLAMLRRRKAA